MKKELIRRGNLTEIMSIPHPSYETAVATRRSQKEYAMQCLRLLKKEEARFPGYVTLNVSRGIPSFTYRKRDLKAENLMKRINSTLARVERVLAKNRG